MKQTDKYLIVIAGPTGVGKTELCLKLATKFDTDIINADSRQIYRELTIGTAKPNQQALESTTHHFVNHVSIHDRFTAADFESESIAILNRLFKEKNCVILSGGTGLYIKAVLEGFDDMPSVDQSITTQLNQEFEENGITVLQHELQSVDPQYYAKVDIQNPRRLIRALSIWRAHSIKFSDLLTIPKKTRDFIPIKILLTTDRKELYERINLRVDTMMKEGLLDEVKDLADFAKLNALQTVGYKELFEALEGKYEIEKAVELIKRNTRRYAKRQMTWYRSQTGWTAFEPTEVLKIAEFIDQNISKL